ncbi:MAG TPA: copper homeostasis protein CutC [Prolixibacteraceae bacterium]
MTIVPPQLIFEACVDTLEDALLAEQQGANRIELCSALDQDGLTPSPELTMQCLEHLSVPIMAMVRPRGGDFAYSEDELRQMEAEIEFFKQAGVAGVVFGMLTRQNKIDIENTRRLAKLALPLEVTFHKAIDYSDDILKSFQELNAIDGITRVLTSGGMNTAWNGRLMIKAMNDLPERRLKIIAAGKVLPENRVQIAEATGVTELHGKKIV